MTYSAKETSAYGGNPVYLYRFTRGGLNFDFCSLAETLIVSTPAGTFVASSIDHGKIGVGQPINKDNVQIIFSLSDDFASLLLKRSTQFAPTTVTIWRGHLDDTANEFRVVFKGKVRAAGPRNDTQIVLSCSGLYSSFKLPGLGGSVHHSCRHALYFGGCRLDKSLFEDVGTVTAIDDNVLTITEAALEADEFYTSGTLEFLGSQTYITGHIGSLITVRYVSSVMSLFFQSGTTPIVTLARGCDHSVDTCVSKFNNVLNFGGFPYIPDNDPFNDGSIA